MNLTVTSNLIQVTTTAIIFPFFFPVNCFLVPESDGLTLIDAGIKASGTRILAAANELGQPIRRILLTHAHSDHVASIGQVLQAFPDAEVLLSAREYKLVQGDYSFEPGEASNSRLKGPFKIGGATSVSTCNEGDEIGSLTAISTPGHTPGHFAFLDRREHTLIAGDAFQLHGGPAVPGVLTPRFPFLAFGTWDKRTALESVKKMLRIEPKRIAVGHGDLLENPILAMKQAIEEAEWRFS